MKFLIASGLGTALLLGNGALGVGAADAIPSYHVAATWKLAGDGGWDYLTLDSKAHRLYIARGSRIQVLDSNSGQLIGEVAGVSGAHGVALQPKTHRAYATSGRTNSVVVFDTQTLKTIGDPIAVGENPDAILVEPKTKRVWAFDAGSEAVSIIDPQTAKVVKTVALGGNPEFAVADGKGHVWVNIESTSEIVELSASDGIILGRTPLAPGEEPTGLSLDTKNGRLFSGCTNNTMVITSTVTNKVLATLPIGAGVDATKFDDKRGLAFSSNGRDGTLSVLGLKAGKLAVLNVIPTHQGARTMALDSATGAVFVVAGDYEAVPAGTERPRMIPGSAIVMKLEPDTKS